MGGNVAMGGGVILYVLGPVVQGNGSTITPNLPQIIVSTLLDQPHPLL